MLSARCLTPASELDLRMPFGTFTGELYIDFTMMGVFSRFELIGFRTEFDVVYTNDACDEA